MAFSAFADLLGEIQVEWSGSETMVFQTTSRALDREKPGLSFSSHHTGRPLRTPDVARNLGPDLELLFLADTRPILAQKLRYYMDREFVGLVGIV